MSGQQVEKPKRGSLWGRFKGFIVKIYILVITAALIHFALSNHSENYRELVGEIEQSVQDIEIELPEFNPTPEPIFFSSDEYGGDAFLPAIVLEPGRYRYIVTGNMWMAELNLCGIRDLFSSPRNRFALDEACEIPLTVAGIGDSPWSIMIEPDLDYQETGW